MEKWRHYFLSLASLGHWDEFVCFPFMDSAVLLGS